MMMIIKFKNRVFAGVITRQITLQVKLQKTFRNMKSLSNTKSLDRIFAVFIFFTIIFFGNKLSDVAIYILIAVGLLIIGRRYLLDRKSNNSLLKYYVFLSFIALSFLINHSL